MIGSSKREVPARDGRSSVTVVVRSTLGVIIRAVTVGFFLFFGTRYALDSVLGPEIAWAPAGAVVALNTLNEFSIKAVIARDGLHVRNALTSNRLRWDDIAQLESGTSLLNVLFGRSGDDIVNVRLKSGRGVPITATFLLNTVDAERFADAIERQAFRHGVGLGAGYQSWVSRNSFPR